MPLKTNHNFNDQPAGTGKVTSKEIAEKLGLARSTVTMALSNSPKIKIATRQRVQDAAREMNYVPNKIARAMITGKTNTLGLIMGVYPGEHVFRIVIGGMEAAMEAGYTLNILRSDWDMDADEMASQCISQCLAGVIVVNQSPQSIQNLQTRLAAAGLPLVTLLAPHSAPSAFSVWSDDAVGEWEAISHLYRLGHRKIGFVGGNPETASGKLRLAGYRDAMEKQGLKVDPEAVIECKFDQVKIERAVRVMLAPTMLRPTALLCANDQVAMTVIRTARRMNLRVPDDLSVIGFSNLNMAEFSDPPLTSIAQDFERVGREAAKAITELLRESKDDFSQMPVREVKIPSWLVVRESTGLAPKLVALS